MQRISPGKIVKLLLISLVVGWLLAFFGVTPDNFWESMGHLAQNMARTTLMFAEWAWSYLLLGAAVVLPIYVAMLIYRKLRGGR